MKSSFDSFQRKDLLQLMLNAKGETGGGKIDYVDIEAQCLTFLLAGSDTSSTTLGFVCYELALHTNVQDKLRDEIDCMWPRDEVGKYHWNINMTDLFNNSSNTSKFTLNA